MFGTTPQKLDIREVAFGSEVCAKGPGIAGGDTYPGNAIKTAKYSIATFLPLNLFEQMHKAANIYFLFVSILMYVGEKTPLYMEAMKAFPTFGTLVAMMAISAVSAGLDDYRRHVADKQTNSQDAELVGTSNEDASTSSTLWADIKVGDTLVVRSGQEVPADMVVLAASGDEGGCYVSTANLDGETSLKPKAPLPATQELLCPAAEQTAARSQDEVKALLSGALGRLHGGFGGAIFAEAPQVSIHCFKGSLRLGTDPEERPLGPPQLLLRGTRLRNTAWCIGLVVYTGPQTRLMMNSRKAAPKLANIERVINLSMLVVLLAQAMMALISLIMYSIERDVYRSYWYLYRDPNKGGILLPEPIGYFITFYILYSNLMPISLYATVEITNKAQAFQIMRDTKMYDKEFEVSALVRSTNLCHELGQIEYVFSDKTGTLTQNVMELKQVFAAGQVFGGMTKERGFQGGQEMLEAKGGDAQCAKDIDAFLEVLAVCHTVVASGSGKDLCYEAESPDEGALVTAAASLEWVFQARKGEVMHVACGASDKVAKYTVLAINAFSSARKRMSMVVKTENDEYLLLAKGADNVMLDLAEAGDPKLVTELTAFARLGLRTLVLARRSLTAKETDEWLVKYKSAQSSLKDREGELEAVAELLEKRLQLVGATAIEDKLQVGVGETIQRLRDGGIKLWVLTGDKLETARTIGFSTNLLSDDMLIQTLTAGSHEAKLEIDEKLRQMIDKATQEHGKRDVAVMITGQALEALMGFHMEEKLLQLAVMCSVVIACRVSPLQKAQLVRLVRKGVKPRPVTLAVGDGANDVPMIQEAQVGVGIFGREGRQAANSADFSIGQFRFLQRLLLVHGRYDYRRTCKFILYTFWRNAVQVLLMFYYSFVSGYSGISLFEDMVRLTFNFILSLPILPTGIYDRDVKDELALQRPMLYEMSRRGLDLGPSRMAGTLLSALVHSGIIWTVCVLALPSMATVHNAGDYYTFGTAVYSVLIVDGMVRVAFLTTTWNWASVVSIVLSLLGYVVFLAVYGVWESLSFWMYGVPYKMASNGPFWICLLAAPALNLVFDFCVAFARIEFCPDLRNHVLEHEDRSQGCASTEMDVEADADEPLRDTGGFDETLAAAPSRWSWLLQPRSVHFEVTRCRAIVIAAAGATFILPLGLIALVASRSVAEFRVQYAGEGGGGSGVWQIACSENATCVANVTLPDDMPAPVLAYYSLEPFYQNYNTYVRNVISGELRGDTATASQRAICKDTETATDGNGEMIVPCGLPATSLFNDGFEVINMPFDKQSIAWESDLERFRNPPNFQSENGSKSWLYERYPDIVSPVTNVRDEGFVAWMRPAAGAWARKRCGYLQQSLKAGQTLAIRIQNRYTLPPSVRKELVFTTATSFEDDGVGIFLLVAGGCCGLAALAMGAQLKFCPRRPGTQRLGAGLPAQMSAQRWARLREAAQGSEACDSRVAPEAAA